MKEIFMIVVDWYMGHIGYGTVCLLMVVESSIIPFPAEIVIPPAAWKAAQGELDLSLVLLSGTVGAVLGALLNYVLAITLGRAFVYRFAKTRFARFLHLDPESVEKSEKFFLRHGSLSTFTGRLVPGIRSLISLPAGLARMKMVPFIVFTGLGAFLWNVVLALPGYFLFGQKEILDRYFHLVTVAGLGLFVLVAAFLVFKAFRKKPGAEG